MLLPFLYFTFWNNAEGKYKQCLKIQYFVSGTTLSNTIAWKLEHGNSQNRNTKVFSWKLRNRETTQVESQKGGIHGGIHSLPYLKITIHFFHAPLVLRFKKKAWFMKLIISSYRCCQNSYFYFVPYPRKKKWCCMQSWLTRTSSYRSKKATLTKKKHTKILSISLTVPLTTPSYR